MSIAISPFIPPLSPTPVAKSLFSTSVTLFLFYNKYICTIFSRRSKYTFLQRRHALSCSVMFDSLRPHGL